MLKTLFERLRCPECLVEPTRLELLSFREDVGHVQDGAVSCTGCGAWFPIDDGLLDLSTGPLRSREHLEPFHRRFEARLSEAGLALPEAFPCDGAREQRAQRDHFDRYATDERRDYARYQNTSFWRSVDRLTFRRWNWLLPADSTVLDVGCADGRSSLQLHGPGRVVLGFDISRRMVRRAIERAREVGVEASTTFFVADGDRLPFRAESFDHVCTYGVLHHLPRAETACREIQRILRPGGLHIGSENNDSIMRWVFDLLMRFRPLWSELAGEEPLISEAKLRRWLTGLGCVFRSYTTVYLPPHLLYPFSAKTVEQLIEFTDRLFGAFPSLRAHGGLIVFEIEKA